MKYVPKSVTRLAGSAALKMSANSPTILVVTGVVGFGATAVMAARAARRAEPVLDNHAKQRIDIASHAVTQKEEKKQVVALYRETTLELAKVYGPTLIVGAASAGSILYGHKILKGRHVATMLAYSGLQDQVLAYRERVARTLGVTAERDIWDGAHGEYVEDPDHKGEYSLQPVWEGGDLNDNVYRPWMDERNDNCKMDPQNTYHFLRGVQNYYNSVLEIKGYVFLNEVRKALGFDEIPEGQILGWRWNGDGDNFVDFGFMTGQDPHTQRFRDGLERTVRLNFNCDGVMFQDIDKSRKLYHQ